MKLTVKNFKTLNTNLNIIFIVLQNEVVLSSGRIRSGYHSIRDHPSPVVLGPWVHLEPIQYPPLTGFGPLISVGTRNPCTYCQVYLF